MAMDCTYITMDHIIEGLSWAHRPMALVDWFSKMAKWNTTESGRIISHMAKELRNLGMEATIPDYLQMD